MSNQEKEEPLMSLRPKTDFQRLLWANNRIKELEKELLESRQQNNDLTEEVEEIKTLLKENSSQLRIRCIKIKSDHKKLKTDYDNLLYKHALLQVEKNIENF